MKYLTLTLFALSALCVYGLLCIPYTSGTPEVVNSTVSQTVYVGSNFAQILFLASLAFAGGLAGFITLIAGIWADKDVRQEEIRSTRKY